MKTLRILTLAIFASLSSCSPAQAQTYARIDGGGINVGAFRSKLLLSDTDSPTFNGVYLGLFGDCLLARSASGVMTVAGIVVPTISSNSALTNKTYNGLTITTSSGTLTITNGKTLTASNSITLQGTDGSTLNIGTGGTLGTGAYAAAFNPAIPGAIGGTTPNTGAFTSLATSGAVGVGGTANANAILDAQSTTKAFMPPRMTKTQRNAIASPTAGMVVYQSDNTPGLRAYNGTNWMKFTESTD